MLKNIQNEIDFWLRRQIRWSFGKKNNFKTIPHQFLSIDIQNFLKQTPVFSAYTDYLPEPQLRENLNQLFLLQTLFSDVSDALQVPKTVLEVGIKNWSTLPSLVTFLNEQFHTYPYITGVEIDLWRVYASGLSRYDDMQNNIALVQKIMPEYQNCIDGIENDVLKLSDSQYDFVCCFLPFVFVEPHSKWGLPKRYFNPEAFFQKLHSLLSIDGLCVLTNQGEQEFEEQKKLLSPYSFRVLFSGPVAQPFLTLQHTRYAWLLQKIA